MLNKWQIFYFLNLNKYFWSDVLDVYKYGKNKNILQNLEVGQKNKKLTKEVKFQTLLFLISLQRKIGK